MKAKHLIILLILFSLAQLFRLMFLIDLPHRVRMPMHQMSPYLLPLFGTVFLITLVIVGDLDNKKKKH